MNVIFARHIRFAFSIACFICANNLNAQWVNIPDNNFLNYLQSSSIGACVSSTQLDTTCQALLEDTLVDCDNLNIINLYGIQFFKKLRYLNCSANPLDSALPVLPASLHTLYCVSTNLRSLSTLPDSLSLLDCAHCQLSTLPPLPNGITYINCMWNNLVTLPALPANLIYLICSYNQIDSLPPLPGNLDSLDCSVNLLSKLPPFPPSLHFLICDQNQLTTLPFGAGLNEIACAYNMIVSLPIYDRLTFLTCGNNQITRLPTFPNSLKILLCDYNNIDSIIDLPNSLQDMTCGYNQLKSLGNKLPDSLQYLGCYNNQLTSIPPLPKVFIDLYCPYNLLTSLPDLPDTLYNLNCSNNPYLQCLPKLTRINTLTFDSTAITCLPNYDSVTTSTPPLNSVPLCTTNNLHGCASYVSIPEIETLNFSMYPNPASDNTTLTLSNGQSELAIEVMDITGSEVVKMSAANTNYELSVKGLPNGLYFVRVSDEQGGFGVRKLVVDK